MKRISNMQDLVQFGINPLTGEACAYSMRLLCDLSEKGCENLSAFFGLPRGQVLFQSNWNSKVGEDDAVGSIMLVRSLVPDLSRFMLYMDGADMVIEQPDGTMLGLWETDEYFERYQSYAETEQAHGEGYRIWRNFGKGTTGRNKHAFTGRTE